MMPTHAEENPSLANQLEQVAAGSAKRMPVDLLKQFQIGIETVRKTGIEQSSKQVGDQAIDATLKGWDGSDVTLSELWERGPVVLMWYRGGWCPYCNVQLRAMQQKLESLRDAGAHLVVLTPELPDNARQTAEANDVQMVALHDPGSELARKYGIVFDLPAPIIPMYRDRLKLAERNGNDAMQLPLSATYVIDQTGEITFAFLDADYKKRAEPDDVVRAVKQLKQ